jgi:hypothetical protein
MFTSYKEIANLYPNARWAWRAVRVLLRKQVAKGDSARLFNACIKDMQRFLADSGQIDDLEGLYSSIASEKVNNPRSSFFIYGR